MESFPVRLQRTITGRWQMLMDKLSPRIYLRWALLLFIAAMYGVRVYIIQGFYIVTYGLGIFLLNILIGVLTPQDDMDSEGPRLPTSNDDKPWQPKLPEYMFWYSCCKACVICFCLTLFPIFNVPVFWPILLIYFLILFFLTMRRQIQHMIKYKYNPFFSGKKTYSKKRSIAEDIRTK